MNEPRIIKYRLYESTTLSFFNYRHFLNIGECKVWIHQVTPDLGQDIKRIVIEVFDSHDDLIFKSNHNTNITQQWFDVNVTELCYQVARTFAVEYTSSLLSMGYKPTDWLIRSIDTILETDSEFGSPAANAAVEVSDE